MFQKIQYGVTDGVATIEMVYPKNLNAIDEQMAEELLAEWQETNKQQTTH